MSIDRIRGRGRTTAASSTPAAAPTRGPFHVQEPAPPTAPDATDATDATGTTGALVRLRSGALDTAGYIAEHVDEATEHLHDLAPDSATTLREMLRDACEGSPLLSELIARASR